MSHKELIGLVEKEKDESIILELVRKGGKAVGDEQARARLEVCAVCPNRGKVEPLPGQIYEGCLLCGCPFASKAYMKTILFKIVKCPDLSGNKWEETDKKFQ